MMLDKNQSIELRAVQYAIRRYEAHGWDVRNVSRIGGEYAGYDLFLQKGVERLKVEVKGCSQLYGIPDLYGSEIDAETLELIADEICVVYFIPDELRVRIAVIPREALNGYVTPKLGYRISGRFKNSKNIGPLLEEA